MLRRELLRALITAPLSGWLRCWMPYQSGAATTQEPNAAAVYRQAFDWAEKLGSDDNSILRKAATIDVDDPLVVALLRQAAPALEATRKAAAIEGCRWKLEAISSDDIGKGHLNILTINAVRAACLSARREARMGRGRRALDDVFAGMTLAHRLGTGGVLFSRVVECGGEVPAFETIGRILTGLDRGTLDDLSRRLDLLPPPEPASSTIGPESRFILSTIRARLVTVAPMLEEEDWQKAGLDPDVIESLNLLTHGDRTALLAHLDATGPAFDELAARLLDLPRPGCREALDEFAKSKRVDQPIVASLVEHAWGVRHMVDRMRALRTMARAGLVLVRDGEPAFLKVRDPFGAGPFGFERKGKGYRIVSALSDRGRPEVTLAVGDLP